MQNNSGNRWMGGGMNSELESGENFFEQQGMMPNKQGGLNSNPNISRQLGNKAIGGANEENIFDNGSTQEALFQTVDNEADVAGAENASGVVKEFSRGKEFAKGDGKIVETQIRELKKDPAAAYEEIQADREAYLEKSFGRILGESK